MKLIALLAWYDAPTQWLANTIASLSRIGVDHIVAVDGRYAWFDGPMPSSGFEQSRAVSDTCDAVGIGLTLHRPVGVWEGEVQKRQFLFDAAKLVGGSGDWLFIIDDDEVITEGSRSIRNELANAPADTHTAAAHLHVRTDPMSSDDPMRVRIAERFANPATTSHLQPRFFRLHPSLRVEHRHSIYVATIDGVDVNMRDDPAGRMLDPPLAPCRLLTLNDPGVVIEHRYLLRDAHRLEQKKVAYRLRDDIGIESLPGQVREHLPTELTDDLFGGRVVTLPAKVGQGHEPSP